MIAFSYLLTIAVYTVDFILLRSYLNESKRDFKLLMSLCLTFISLVINGIIVLTSKEFIL